MPQTTKPRSLNPNVQVTNRAFQVLMPQLLISAKPQTGVPTPEEDGFINGISPKQVYRRLKKMAS